MVQVVKIIYHLVAFIIFMIQARESLNKYFQNPVVVQKLWKKDDNMEKPDLLVCFQSFFDYTKASQFGFGSRTDFLAGMTKYSTKPTWTGQNENSTFKEILDIVYEKDFSQVKIENATEVKYVFNHGYCKQINIMDKHIRITSGNKNMVVYLQHSSTDPKLFSELDPDSYITFGSTSKTTYDDKNYEIFYEIHDITINEGTTCVDYRKQKETFGGCNIRVFKQYMYSAYGCYPPWIDETDKNCEIGIEAKEIEPGLLNNVTKDINALIGRRIIEVMKQCLHPCYQVKTHLKLDYLNLGYQNPARLDIYKTGGIVPVLKSVHSFDIFTLAVELGSALGLWLGKIICFYKYFNPE